MAFNGNFLSTKTEFSIKKKYRREQRRDEMFNSYWVNSQQKRLLTFQIKWKENLK